MGAFTTTDFASLLDQMIEADKENEFVSAARPSIPVDFLGLTPALPPTDPVAAADYLFQAADNFAIVPPEAELVELPSIQPSDIQRELALTGKEKPEALDRIRREFAFANHPDRVSEDLRDIAIVRMQIANRMIDDAKEKWQQAKAGR